MFEIPYGSQGRNHRGNLGASAPMVGRICHPGWNRVKVSEYLAVTAVAPVTTVDTSLDQNLMTEASVAF